MKNKNCQSCGMPLNKDPNQGGVNADGSKSEAYCSYCYSLGEFTQPDMTVDEMKLFVKGKMRDMGFPGFLVSFFTKRIPKLERWKNQN